MGEPRTVTAHPDDFAGIEGLDVRQVRELSA